MFAKLDIPPKVHVIGLCWSGHLVALYASAHPERIASYFGISPVGFAPFKSIEDANRIDIHPMITKRINASKVWIDDKMNLINNRLYSGRHLEGRPVNDVRKFCKYSVNGFLHGLKVSDEFKENVIEFMTL